MPEHFKFHRVNAPPATGKSGHLYFVNPTDDGLMAIYLGNADGTFVEAGRGRANIREFLIGDTAETEIVVNHGAGTRAVRW